MNLSLQGLSSIFSVPFKGSDKGHECPVMFPAEFENPVLSMAAVTSMFDVPQSVTK